MPTFDALVAAAERQSFAGWDFSWVRGRVVETALPWVYRHEVLRRVPAAEALLDMDTGGGEFLAGLAAERPLPARTAATEGYGPNIPIARDRLGPLGVDVVAVGEDEPPLPFPDATFDLVINRHGSFPAGEIARVLRPGGTFLTQQVGGGNLAAVNELLGAPPYPYAHWTLEAAVAALRSAGLVVPRAEEAFPGVTFTDVGALVFQLRAVEWQVPGFTVAAYRDALRRLHERMPVTVAGHRFLIEAARPA